MAQGKISGVRVVGIDVNQSRLEIAKDKFGADYVIDAAEDPVHELISYNGGYLAHAVFDATGAKQALESGIDYMCHGGKYILVGLHNGGLTWHHPSIHARESTILCSRNATVEDFNRVIDILGKATFPVEDYITHKVTFDTVADHFDSWIDPQNEVIKAMVTF